MRMRSVLLMLAAALLVSSSTMMENQGKGKGKGKAKVKGKGKGKVKPKSKEQLIAKEQQIAAAQGQNIKYPPVLDAIQGFDRFDHAFEHYPRDAMWRFWIDWKDHHRGEFAYDAKDRAFTAGMALAYKFIRKTIGWPNNLTYYFDLHELGIKGVRNASKPLAAKRKWWRTGWRRTYGIGIDRVTPEARKEWCSEELIFYGPPLVWLNRDCAVPSARVDRGEGGAAYYSLDQKKIVALVGHEPINLGKSHWMQRLDRGDRAWERYEAQRASAQTDDDVLAAVARILRYMFISHFFGDGNMRAINALLQKLLIENGFYPALLDDSESLGGGPACSYFGGYLSADQLVVKLREGIQRFRNSIPSESGLGRTDDL